MKTLTYLIVPYDDFKANMENNIKLATELHNTSVTTNEDLMSLVENRRKWIDDCLNILRTSFNDVNNQFTEDFQYVQASTYQVPGFINNLNQKTELEKETIQLKQKSLWDSLRLISVSDAISRHGDINLDLREKYTINEKLELILDKLYEIYDDYYYPIKEILTGNGINLKRYDEDREFATILENNGYIEMMATHDGVNAKLTASGAMYVEEKRRSYKENYEEISGSQQEINQRIDEIIEHLTNHGYGQEIIFNEIQELKEMYGKLGKKNWGQLVKGKLFDLAIAKLVENDTIKYIYEKITDRTLRLP